MKFSSVTSSERTALTQMSSDTLSNHGSTDLTNEDVVVVRREDVEQGGTADDRTASTTRTSSQHQVYLTFAVCLMLGLVSGTLYGYGRYSKDLKDALDLTHYQLERLGILLDTGNYFGHPIIGYLYDHHGPQMSCIWGAIIVLLSYGMIHASVAGVVPAGGVVLGGSFLLVGFGSGFGYTAALGSTTKKFSATPYRSLAVGIVASGYGLCSTLVGISYSILGLKHFFLFWAILVATVNLLGVMVFADLSHYTTTEAPSLGGEDQEHTESFQDEAQLSENGRITTVSSADTEEDTIEPSSSHDETVQDEPLLISEEEQAPPLSPLQRWVALRSGDFWMLFAAFACCTGCGLFVINNVSTMVQSIGGHDRLAGRLVILLSFCNCGGRILMGSLADRPRMPSKIVLFGLSSLTMALALFASAMAGLAHAQVCLVATVALVAAAYGGVWVLIVGILSDWFGTHDFGKNYGLIAMGPAVSGMIFNAASAAMYQNNIVDDDSSVCEGTVCYRGSFLLTASAATVCIALLCCLACRRHYKGQIRA